MSHQAKKLTRKLENSPESYGLWAGRVSWVLKERTRNQPADVGFWMTTGVVGSSGNGLSTGGLSGLGGWAGGLDCPNKHYYTSISSMFVTHAFWKPSSKIN